MALSRQRRQHGALLQAGGAEYHRRPGAGADLLPEGSRDGPPDRASGGRGRMSPARIHQPRRSRPRHLPRAGPRLQPGGARPDRRSRVDRRRAHGRPLHRRRRQLHRRPPPQPRGRPPLQSSQDRLPARLRQRLRDLRCRGVGGRDRQSLPGERGGRAILRQRGARALPLDAHPAHGGDRGRPCDIGRLA